MDSNDSNTNGRVDRFVEIAVGASRGRDKHRAFSKLRPLRLQLPDPRLRPIHYGLGRQPVFVAAGRTHDPSRIDGFPSFGQYSRIIRINLPFGEGSQFDSLSAPGDSCWM